jgi:hypothetical protein
VQVNGAPNVQAFLPAIAAAADGGIAVTYLDFRNDEAVPAALLARYWKTVSRDGGSSWSETPVAAPFDLLTAALATGGQPFLGDYQGLAATGNRFLAFYVAANSGDTANPTSVFASADDLPADKRSTSRVEINLHPRPGFPEIVPFK